MGTLLLLPFLVADRAALLFALVTSATPTDPVTLLITYGPLGIFLVLLGTGTFRTKYEVQRLEKQIDALNERLDDLIAEGHGKDEVIRAFTMQITGHALPALAQTARVFEAIPASDGDVLAQLKRAQAEIARLAEQIASSGKGDGP